MHLIVRDAVFTPVERLVLPVATRKLDVHVLNTIAAVHGGLKLLMPVPIRS